MKQVLIVAVGCLPLGWFTAGNVVRWQAPVDSAVTAAARPKLDLSAIQERVTKAEKKTTDDLPFARKLVALEPFGDSLLVIDPMAVEVRFKPVAMAWQAYAKSHAAVVGVGNVYRTRLPVPEEEAKQLTRYLDARPVAGLPGGDLVESWCKKRIDVLEKSVLIVQSLKEIQQHFAARQFADVIRRIDLLPRDVLTTAEKGEVERLLRKSNFGVHWQGPGAAGAATPLRARARIVKLIELLKKSPLPLDEEDQAVVARYEQEKADLLRKLKVDELFESPPKRLLDLVEECVRILDDDPVARPWLNDGLKAWIEARARTKLPPEYHPNLKEAWYKGSGMYRRGVFQRSVSKEPKFLYWIDPERTRKTHDTEIYLKELDGTPDEMLEIRLCRQYNGLLAGLRKELGSQSAWEGFARSCEEMQSQLTDYYTKVPSKPATPVSFQAEGQLAREILGQWSKVVRILE